MVLANSLRGFLDLASLTAWTLGTGAPLQEPLHLAPSQLLASDSAPSGASSAISPEVSAFAEALREAHGIHGISVGVVRLNAGVVTSEFGTWGTMTEEGDPVRKEALFPIGSSSKAFLVSAVGILMDDFANGRNVTALPPNVSAFTWDTKLQDLLPSEWKLADDWATAKLNVRDILTHVSGLPRHEFSYQRDDSPSTMIGRLKHLKPFFEPRQRWWYNNQMYVLASHIVSTYSGKSFREFVQERIFDPLNMTSTTYSPVKAQASGNFSQIWSTASAGRRIPYWIQNEVMEEFIAGAGGIISSTVDMTKWVAMLLNRGVDLATNQSVVPGFVFTEMTTAHSMMYGTPRDTFTSIGGYGMGWMRSSFQGHDMIFHGGTVPGSLTEVVFYPNDNIGVVAFINTDDEHGVQTAVPRRIVEDLLGLKHSVELPSLASAPDHGNALRPARDAAAQRADDFDDVPLALFEGTYSDPGYGTLRLCTSTSAAAHCAPVLSDFASLGPANGSSPSSPGRFALDPHTLYARSTSFLAAHVSFRRRPRGSGPSPPTGDGERVVAFDIGIGTIFPEGYGRDTSPFMLRFDASHAHMECVLAGEGLGSVVDGCGLVNLEGAGAVSGKMVSEKSDVYFKKVV